MAQLITELSKKILRSILRPAGFDIIRYQKEDIGKNVDQDISRLISSDKPIILDVGSNNGQSVYSFRKIWPKSVIHCFEPGKSTFVELSCALSGFEDVTLNNCAVGQVPGVQEFHEYDQSVMNSFFEPDSHNWSAAKLAYPVEIVRLDEYCGKSGIDKVNLLKTDTQGYDLEVLLGAKNLMDSSSIELILCEVIYNKLYRDQPEAYEFFKLFAENGFKLISVYNLFYGYGRLGWCDVLFAHESILDDGAASG